MFVNFALLLVILYFILRKPIGGGAKERRARLEKEIEEARALKEAAESALAEAKAKMDSLDAEMAKLRQEVVDGGKSEAARITSEAEARAERMQADTTALVEQEVARMSRAIREEVVTGIVDRAEALVREKIRGDDQTRLANEYVRELSDTSADKPGN
jgi:F-type H+-transporting ATPase subunit b